MITITIQDREVIATLQAITQRIGNMAPVLQAIGDDITERTKRRFDTSTGADGATWKNSPVTLGIYSLRLGQSHRKKDGSLNKRGEARVAGKKPLIDTGELRRQIVPQVSNNVLTVTATPAYAGIHQFGGQAGRNRKVKIPARPYLPVKADGNLYPQEQALILETLQSFLTQDL